MRGGYSPARGLQNTNPQWVVAPEKKIQEFCCTSVFVCVQDTCTLTKHDQSNNKKMHAMINSNINVKFLVTVVAAYLVCTCLCVYTNVSGTEFILFLVILKEKDVGSGERKIPYTTSYISIPLLFYMYDICRIMQANKDFRTLNNLTGLFDGGCVRSEWQDATDIVVKARPAGNLVGCAEFPVAGCCRRRSKPMDY
jgi:hypothetical protein